MKRGLLCSIAPDYNVTPHPLSHLPFYLSLRLGDHVENNQIQSEPIRAHFSTASAPLRVCVCVWVNDHWSLSTGIMCIDANRLIYWPNWFIDQYLAIFVIIGCLLTVVLALPHVKIQFALSVDNAQFLWVNFEEILYKNVHFVRLYYIIWVFLHL